MAMEYAKPSDVPGVGGPAEALASCGNTGPTSSALAGLPRAKSKYPHIVDGLAPSVNPLPQF